MELWYTEKQTDVYGITAKIKETLYNKQSPFQHLAVIDTIQFGKMLVLDGMVQITAQDEFVYHEMITHVALNTHVNPCNVAVIGGGDGGTIREVIKHPSVKKATLVEIDEEVVEVSKKFFPEVSCSLDDSRVEVIIADGLQHISEKKKAYDIVLIDSTEPVGSAVGLFSPKFYQDVYESLKDDGILVAQTESPFFNEAIIKKSFSNINKLFAITRLYLANVPTYPSGLWSFTIGSKKYDPLNVDSSQIADMKTNYYNSAIHKAAFQLPEFAAKLLTKQ